MNYHHSVLSRSSTLTTPWNCHSVMVFCSRTKYPATFPSTNIV